MTTEILQPTDTKSDRIKLPLTFNVKKMKEEVEALGLNTFVYYNVMPLRSPAHIVDTSLPFPPPAEDYADGSWTDWLNTSQLEASPYLKRIVEKFQEKTTVTLVRLLRLEKGNVVKEHRDVTLGLQEKKSVIRLTIPIIKDENADFYLNNKRVPMKPGECWYLRLTDPHRVENNSDTDRINITLDMIPNEWVRNMILENDN
tara:strand:+ start:61392 stop:61994 length:603 start_codon:yes stop_codon:yes gene_type:complete